MNAGLWRFVEWRLRRAVPAHRINAVLADLAEDYAARDHDNPLRAGWWLFRESRALAVAYRRRDLETWVASTSQDLRFALRSVGRHPARFIAAVSLLGIAVGLTTAMFTVIDALSLRPVPFKDPDQLAYLSLAAESSRGGGFAPPPVVLDALRASGIFAAAEAVNWDVARVATDEGEVQRSSSKLAPGVFGLLGGVRPLLGRLFDAEDGMPGHDDRVLVSEDLWRTSFHADPNLVGRTITVDHKPAFVVGVLPADFRFPNWNTSIWQATHFAPADRPSVLVRIAANVPMADAMRMATAAARNLSGDYAAMSVTARPVVTSELDKDFQQASPLLAGGVVLLFLVLCANVSSLQLAGITARGREFATRAALGASRTRLVRQVFIESAVSGAAGVAVGIALGSILLSLAQTWLLDSLSLHTLNAIDIDMRTLAVTSMAGFVATLSAGVLPAVIGTRVDPSRSLQLTSRSGTESSRARAASRALLVGQIALSCTLLIGAALLVRSFVKLAGADRGLDTRGIVVARIDLPSSSYGKDNQPLRDMIKQAVIEQARAIPGVSHAAWSYGTPPYGATKLPGLWTSDAPGMQPLKIEPYVFRVDPDFFGLYNIPILRGRALDAADTPATALVGERFANILWPGLDPIGRTFTKSGSSPFTYTVVGVARELRLPSLDRKLDAPQFYVRLQVLLNMGTVSLRCGGDCSERVVRQRLEAAYPGFEVYAVNTLQSAYAKELARPRAAAALAFAFAATALVAAAAGLFTLLSSIVARRRREFGIRTALGASALDVRRIVVRDGIGVTLTGLVLGAGAALALARIASSFLFDVTTTDPLSWTMVLVAMTLTVAAALWHPVRTAVRTNPVMLLRDE